MFNSSNPEDWTIFDEIKSNFIGMYDTDYSVDPSFKTIEQTR